MKPSLRWQARLPASLGGSAIRPSDVDAEDRRDSWDTKAEALAALTITKGRLDRGAWKLNPAAVSGIPLEAPKTFADAVEAVCARSDLGVKTRSDYRCHGRRLATEVPWFHAMTLVDIDTAVLLRCVAAVAAAGASRNTVAARRRFVSAALSEAVMNGWIAANPMLAVPRRARTKATVAEDERESVLLPTWREAAELVQNIEDRTYQMMIVTMMFCGLRLGEAAALMRGDFDADAGELVIRAVRSKETGKPWATEPTKTGHERRVPVPAGLCDWLVHHRHHLPAPMKDREDFLFPFVTARPRGGIGNVTSGILGAVLDRARQGTTLAPDASSPDAARRRGVTPKDLRAFAVSVLVDCGGTELEAQRLLGHQHVNTTKTYYLKATDSREHDPDRARLRIMTELSLPERMDSMWDAWVAKYQLLDLAPQTERVA